MAINIILMVGIAMNNPEPFLPLTPLSLGILLALATEDRHGYAILKEIEQESGARLRPGTGTLYSALQRMTDEGLIEASSVQPEGSGDARRRYYSISPLGRDVAAAELNRLARLVELGVSKRLVGQAGHGTVAPEGPA
jgi:DNA-binding PadR family transcriptional regulator